MFALYSSVVGIRQTAFGPSYGTSFSLVGHYASAAECRLDASKHGPGHYEVWYTQGENRGRRLMSLEVVDRMGLPTPLRRASRAVCHN